MASYKVEPVPGFETKILDQFRSLSVTCASGFDHEMDTLEESEPGVLYRCGLLDDRHELFAVPLPDCDGYKLILTIDRKDPVLPRSLHAIIPAADKCCTTGAMIATRQLGLINPSWET
jgi:hypothetical protein